MLAERTGPHLFAASPRILAVAALMAAGCGCSVKRMAINKIGNALASGGSTYERDEDPELVDYVAELGNKLVLIAPADSKALVQTSDAAGNYATAHREALEAGLEVPRH